MLAIEALTKRFGGVVAVDGVSFGVNAGEVVGLIGPNEAGKTTVLNLVTGFSRPSAGKVLFNGKEVTGTPPYALAKLGIVRTFQTTSLFSRMTVLENVRIGTHLRAGRRKCQAIGAIPRGDEPGEVPGFRRKLPPVRGPAAARNCGRPRGRPEVAPS